MRVGFCCENEHGGRGLGSCVIGSHVVVAKPVSPALPASQSCTAVPSLQAKRSTRCGGLGSADSSWLVRRATVVRQSCHGAMVPLCSQGAAHRA